MPVNEVLHITEILNFNNTEATKKLVLLLRRVLNQNYFCKSLKGIGTSPYFGLAAEIFFQNYVNIVVKHMIETKNML
jgi:hypothetical protein